MDLVVGDMARLAGFGAFGARAIWAIILVSLTFQTYRNDPSV